MQSEFRTGHLTIDFETPPFASPVALWLRATRLFAAGLPMLAAISLLVFIPAKLAVQSFLYLLDLPKEGILAYALSSLGDLVFGALVAPAVIYALVARLRTGKPARIGDALRWGRRLWGKSLWNEFKMEVTVMLWSLLLFVPGIVAWTRLALTDAVVAIEGDRTREVLARSSELTEGYRWRILLALLPGVPIALAHLYVLLRVMQYSPWLAPFADSLFSVADQWLTAAIVVIYLGVAAPEKPASSKRARRAA
jgi:hypothetical protein